ncbi:hypothetical protein [Bacillus cereus]|uniref:hypothetical protein n=1 Tax=Bacillus cereus TaxID=1396 RepID=UPI000BFE0B24|nr:hypothetical protein [Bacillus cereus]MDR4442203.1 hypothetical protein [Bacillus cereus]PGY84622.1 hypothetical protein COE36_16730 [Bacillus cereus]
MWHEIFFDKNGVFQWASIAAIVSGVALVSTIISIILTQYQAKKNRKSSTLVSLRIEELKDVRKESGLAISTARAFVEEYKYNEIHIADLNSFRDDPKLKEYIKQLSVLFSILYRNTPHTEKFIEKIEELDMKLLQLKSVFELGDWSQEFEFAVKEYSRIEYEEIEESI